MGQGANQFLFVQGCHVGDTQIHFVHLASELVTGHVACRNKDTVSIYLFIYMRVYIYILFTYVHIPVVLHKAVAEVSKIGNL